MPTGPLTLTFEEVRRLLPQTHPFLMVDKVVELIPGERIIAQKNISGNETFFEGHFPGMAIMPAALILEALAQATIVLVRKSAELAAQGAPPDPSVYLFGSVHAKMQRPVFPGDVMKLEVKLVKLFGAGGAAEGVATVDGNPCTSAEMFFSKVRLADFQKPR
ncbi:MAG: 3-hydroxyacyl-ACP dehydratase FabZ [Planctomycetota bacterium]|nr:MAG: 3-hydroxyacyl-ACP dehydratase FabZ [Planctomycetota bacterium]